MGARRPVERRGGIGAVLVRTQEFAVRNVPVPDCYDVGAVVPGDELQYLRTGVLVCLQCVGSVGCWALLVRKLGYCECGTVPVVYNISFVGV